MPNSIDNTIATISTKSPRDAISLIHFHAIVVYLTITALTPTSLTELSMFVPARLHKSGRPNDAISLPFLLPFFALPRDAISSLDHSPRDIRARIFSYPRAIKVILAR